jgi:hypothetical protein
MFKTGPEMSKITVISQKGRLVGTWIPPLSTISGVPVSTPIAGTGQTLHEIEIEDPESFVRRKALPELHDLVRRRLGLK